MASATRARDRIHTLADRRHSRRVSRPGRLGIVVAALHEVVLELLNGGAGLFDEDHEAVAARLGDDFLGEGEQAISFGVGDGAGCELGGVWQRAQDDVAAGDVGEGVGFVVGAGDGCAVEEVDEACEVC